MSPQVPEGRRKYRMLLSVLGTAAFLVIVPGLVIGVVPWLTSGWRTHARFPGSVSLRILGGLLILAGIVVLLNCFARFALQGLGTPAPAYPTAHLVVKGFYQYVRNPMYVSVLAALLGQSLLFLSSGILIYALVVLLFVHLFILLYEEPTLRNTFGEEYATYCANVPRWLPRLTPWRADHS